MDSISGPVTTAALQHFFILHRRSGGKFVIEGCLICFQLFSYYAQHFFWDSQYVPLGHSCEL